MFNLVHGSSIGIGAAVLACKSIATIVVYTPRSQALPSSPFLTFSCARILYAKKIKGEPGNEASYCALESSSLLPCAHAQGVEQSPFLTFSRV